MAMKRAKRALPEVIPPRICVTFRRTSFWYRPKTLNMWTWKHPDRTHEKYQARKPRQLSRKSHYAWKSIGTGPIFDESGWKSSHLKLKVPWIQWDPSEPPKHPYKIQNRPKIQCRPFLIATYERSYNFKNSGQIRPPPYKVGIIRLP